MNQSPDYTAFLKERYWSEVLEFGKYYPDVKIFNIDYSILNNFDNNAGELLISNPDRELKYIATALCNLDMPELDNIGDVMINIIGFPDREKIPIYKISHEQVNKLISVEGRITKIAPKYQKLVNGAFKCQRCGDVTFLQQPDDRYIEPFECASDACGRKGPFKLVPEQSGYEDQQKIGVQDLYETMKPGQPLREIIVLICGDERIANLPGMGAQCTITGIIRLKQKKDTSIYIPYLESNNIEQKETELDTSLSEAEKREFKVLAERPDIMQVLIDSTAPDILGHAQIKSALLCSVVSGSDNPRFREYLHVILCGDPGTGKSALLKAIRVLVPRAQYSAGRGSSVAGLTVAVVKDELSGGGFTAQAGALVLADRGLMVLDEVDKLEKEDFQALNTALEEGFIEVHKAGLHQKMSTRCSVVALCNPKNIRFDPYEPLTKQISIPGDTLSRFGLVFKIQDIPNPDSDRQIAEHQAKQWEDYETGCDKETGGNDEILLPEKLSKYLQFARTIKPHTTPETRAEIVNYFLSLRAMGDTDQLAATARQNHDLYRLTKAIAKLRLSDECNLEDTAMAIKIHQASLEALKDPKTGKVDIDIIFGAGKSQRDRLKNVRELIVSLQGSNGGAAHYNEIIQKGTDIKMSRESIMDDLHKLKSSGDVIEVSEGMYRAV